MFNRTISVDLSLLFWIIAAILGAWVIIAQGKAANLFFSARNLSLYAFEFIVSFTLYPKRMDGYRFSYEGFGWQNRRDRIRWLVMLVISFVLAGLSILISGASLLQISETAFVATTETVCFGLWLPNLFLIVLERIPLVGRLKALRINKTPWLLVLVAEVLSQLIFMGLHGHKYTGRALQSVFWLGLVFNGIAYYFPGVGVALHFVNNLASF